MANSNVRFYKLSALPNFEAKYKGIFVHVTSNLTRRLLEDKVTYEYHWDGKLTNEEIQQIVIQIIEKPVLVPEWMASRRIDIVESGLWFGGENGWELLSNDTTSGAIDAAINAKIDTLNAGGFTQATIGANPEGSESATGSTLTIKGIKEEKGIIKQDNSNDVNIAIDGVYDKTDNKIATESTVTNAVTTAIGALDAETVQAVTFNTSVANGNTTLTFKGIKETNGVIAQGDGATNFIVGDAKLNIEIGTDSFEVFSANAKENKSIYLDKNVFKKDVVEGKNVLSVIAKSDVTSTNLLVTQNDIANLGGAMHYKGAITSANSSTPDNWPTTVAAGDVYIATGNFGKDGNTIESGDLIVFNSESLTDYTVVQSNLTLGTGIGQVAANSAALANNKLVVASATGIETIDFDKDNLISADNNKRTLSIGEGAADGVFHHDVTITDALTVIGKPFTKTINISSTNRSIEIAKNGETGVVVDLVWNTSMDPDPIN